MCSVNVHKGDRMSIAESLLPEFDMEMANTRKTVERLPNGKFSYRPHDKSYSLGELASHLVNILNWVEMTLNQDSFDVNPDGGESYTTPQGSSAEELVKWFDASVATARKAIASASDETMMKPWSLKSGGETIFTMPRVAVLRSFIMNHLIHHRAQLTVYLRLNDVPVPALYGPSADEQIM